MKSIYILMLLFGILSLNTGCKSAKYQSTANPDMTRLESAENLHPAISLADHLRKLPGVSVVGDGPNTIVTLKGFKSFEGHLEPLFVVDGTMVSGGYLAAAGTVDVNDIKSIRVVRDINERAHYGFRGSNGVIEIKTKK